VIDLTVEVSLVNDVEDAAKLAILRTAYGKVSELQKFIPIYQVISVCSAKGLHGSPALFP
jgi:reverse gyrase